MDNNFNQGQPIQAQPQYSQQPIQPQQADPFGQQQYSQPQYTQQPQAPKQPSKINLFELLSIILAGSGMFMVFLGTIFTCSCSASKSVKDGKFTMSPVMVLTILGIMVAIAGVVLAVLALKDTKSAKKADKLAKLGGLIGIFAVIYGILPTVTVCGYNCSLTNASESYYEDLYDSLDDLDDYFGY